MSHNSSISGMGDPVPAIRVINEKQMLLITVGIIIMLSCGKEYVKLAWKFICRPGRENLDFLQVKKSEMTRKTKNIMGPRGDSHSHVDAPAELLAVRYG